MEKQEEWRPVVGYEDLYEVSDCGRVKSLNYRNTGKEGIMKLSPDGDGYLCVGLCKNGKQKTCQVHQLVMLAFVGKCPENHEVDHYDWNSKNNRLENLSYQPKEVNRARHSPEWYKNTAEANKKRAADPEWRKNHAEAMKKRSENPNWRKNQAEATRKACSKPIEQYTLEGDYIKTWESATEAAMKLELSKGNLSACCKGKRKSTGGFIWRMAQ